MSGNEKWALTPRLRFPEFREAEEWENKPVGEVFRVTRGEVLAMSRVKENPSEDSPYPVYSSQTKKHRRNCPRNSGSLPMNSAARCG